MATTGPYRKLCNDLKLELQTINWEIESIPSSFTHLLSSKIRQFFGTNQDETVSTVSFITSRLEKIRSKAMSAIENIERQSSQSSDELSWKEKLTDILLDIDVSFLDLADKAETKGISPPREEIKPGDLPDKLDFDIIPSSQANKEKDLIALNYLRERGILTTHEYEDKIRSLQ
jgi:hypothetical protein